MMLKQIAYVESSFSSKFGIPKQSNILKDLKSTLIFEPDYQDPNALRGLEEFSHLWLIWGFSQIEKDTWSPTVRPPRLGGNRKVGVFATRSPFRPNPIGLSSVKIEGIEKHTKHGFVIHILGGDLMDKTPIYDIKPYIPYTDCHPEAREGFAGNSVHFLEVSIGDQWLRLLPKNEQENLIKILALDPRPAYQRDPDRIYGMTYGGFNVRFMVQSDVLTVIEITNLM